MRAPLKRVCSAIVAALALLACADATQLFAQDVRSRTQGFIIGLNLTGVSLEVEDGDQESGGGGGLTFGYGVSRRVAIVLRGDIAEMDVSNPAVDGTYGFVMVDLGVRVALGGPQRRLVPYLSGSLSAMTLAATIEVGPVFETDVRLTGGGISLGGGIQYYFTPGFALDIQALLSAGVLNEFELGDLTTEIDDLDASAGRLNVGLVFYPSRR
jgi:hypothetical protein